MVGIISQHQRELREDVERGEYKEHQAVKKLEKLEEDVREGWAYAAELEKIAMIDNDLVRDWEEQLGNVQGLIEKQSIAQNELVRIRRDLQDKMQELEYVMKVDSNKTMGFAQRWMESMNIGSLFGGAGDGAGGDAGAVVSSGSGDVDDFGTTCTTTIGGGDNSTVAGTVATHQAQDICKPSCGIMSTSVMSASDNVADMIYPGPTDPSYYDFDIDKVKLKKRPKPPKNEQPPQQQKEKQKQKEQKQPVQEIGWRCGVIDGMAEMIYPSYNEKIEPVVRKRGGQHKSQRQHKSQQQHRSDNNKKQSSRTRYERRDDSFYDETTTGDYDDDDDDDDSEDSDISYDSSRGINFGKRTRATRERHTASKNPGRAENFG